MKTTRLVLYGLIAAAIVVAILVVVYLSTQSKKTSKRTAQQKMLHALQNAKYCDVTSTTQAPPKEWKDSMHTMVEYATSQCDQQAPATTYCSCTHDKVQDAVHEIVKQHCGTSPNASLAANIQVWLEQFPTYYTQQIDKCATEGLTFNFSLPSPCRNTTTPSC